MKTITKTALTIIAITFSAAALAHYSGNGMQSMMNADNDGKQMHSMMNSGKSGNRMHSMMNTDTPEYQEMLERRNNPEAMAAWKQNMRENPEVMFEWMDKMHGNFENNANHARLGCHGHSHDSDSMESDNTESK